MEAGLVVIGMLELLLIFYLLLAAAGLVVGLVAQRREFAWVESCRAICGDLFMLTVLGGGVWAMAVDIPAARSLNWALVIVPIGYFAFRVLQRGA